jgi:ribose 5-phosphate isomerase B
MKIFIGCDHAAFDEKEAVKAYLCELGHEVEDCGTLVNERVDYPDHASAVAKSVLSSPDSRGILLCGSGIGVSMVANSYAGIRAALCRTVEEAKLSRGHNDANVLCAGARLVELSLIKEMISVWLEAPFEGGRHQDRVNKFSNLGEKLA